MKREVQYKAYSHYTAYKRVQQKTTLELLNIPCQNQELCSKIGVEDGRKVNFPRQPRMQRGSGK